MSGTGGGSGAGTGRVPGLSDVDLYNVKNLEKLEEMLLEHVSSGAYNFQVYRAILKLLQFHPERANQDLINLVFLKALTALPDPDFLHGLYLVPEHAESGLLADLVEMERLMQAFDLERFWAKCEEPQVKEVVSRVAGFEEAIRKYIIMALSITHQTLAIPIVEEALRLKDLTAVAHANGWTLEGDYVVFPPNPENQGKPKQLRESMTFADVAPVLAVCTGRS